MQHPQRGMDPGPAAPVRSGRAWACAWGAALLLVPVLARAAEVPPAMQAVLLVKALAYDQNLKARAGDAVSVVVVYRPGGAAADPASTGVVNALAELAKKSDVGGLPLRVSALPYTTPAALDAAVQAQHAAVVFLGPGLAEAVAAVSMVTRKRSALSAGAGEDYVRAGLSLGISTKDDKPVLLVNLAAARAENVKLDANFLRIAQVIQ